MQTMTALTLAPIVLGVVFYKIPLKISKILLVFTQIYLGFTAFTLMIQTNVGEYIREFMGGETPILFIELISDRVSFVLVALSVLMFSVAFLYAWKEDYFDNRYLLLFLILQGLTIGLFFTDDLFNLFVLMEVSTVVATILIMYRRHDRAIYDGLYYFIIQIVSMMFYLFGLAYIYRIFGVLSISEIAQMIPLVGHASLILPFSFMMAGISLKIGLFPLFSWVSKAYGTPSAPFAVMAILSGMFIKVSLFLFLRLSEVFQPVIDYNHIFLALGFLTGVAGFIKAVGQKNIKLILAYSTISQVGLMVMAFFSGSQTAYWGGMYHIINHAIIKVMLFFVAGIVYETYGTKNIYEIQGVRKQMPFISLVILIGFFGITGAPLLNGSISKYWLMIGVPSIVEAGMWVINLGTMMTYIKFSSILFGESEQPRTIVSDKFKTITLAFLSAFVVLGGIFGIPLANFLFQTSLSIALAGYLQKIVIWLVLFMIGYVIFRYVLNRNSLMYRYLQGTVSLPFSVLLLMIVFVGFMVYGVVFGG